MKRVRKKLLIVLGVVVGIVVLIIVFISPITKYLVEKYDEKYTGRQIKMDWAYVNPFTGYLHFSNLRIYEYQSDSIFFSSSVSTKFALLKAFSKTYEISELTLNRPKGYIIQNKKQFNFNDLIEKFSSKDTMPSEPKEPVHFNILNIRIKDGEFHYRDEATPVYYFIKEVNIDSEGKRWDSDSIMINYSFLSGIGSGEIKGSFDMDLASSEYRVAAIIKQFDLQIIGQYLRDLTNYGTFTAFLEADIESKGSFKDNADVTMKGKVAVSDFHFGKNPQEDYMSFDRFMVAIEELSPKKRIYSCDSIVLDRPYFIYERYDQLDNLQNIFGRQASNIKEVDKDETKFNLVIEIAHYVKVLASNFFNSPYKIDKLNINNGNFVYNDYSLSEKFSIRLDPLNVGADSIDRDHRGGQIFLKTGIKPHGEVGVVITVNPDNNSDFTVRSHIKKVPAPLFNPYIITFTSFPLNRGTIEFNSVLTVKEGQINSNNHLLIIDPKVTKRMKNKNLKWIPTPLIMTLVREYGNVIDYEIPITGNLKNPKFHFKDILLDLLQNIFVKPVTTPYRMEVKNVETKIEQMRTFKWPMRKSSLNSSQDRFLSEVADFLNKNPEASVRIQPKLYAAKEKEYILFFEARKRYFMEINKMKPGMPLSSADSLTVDKMSVKDSAFVRYLEQRIKDTMLFTIQEKCIRWVDTALVNQKYEALNEERKKVFLEYFEEQEVQSRVVFDKADYIVPYNGFSFYKIDYKGEFPESLNHAYEKINDLNDEAPRRKFREKRRRYTRL